jgi:hypothetical protein
VYGGHGQAMFLIVELCVWNGANLFLNTRSPRSHDRSITLGIAFTAAQQSVGYIKKAIALGKDVNSLYGQFARFFENSDTIHSANIKAQNSKNILTDGQIRALSIQIAMQSKALRDAEKDLKELLYGQATEMSGIK